MEELKKIEKILSNWKEQGKANTEFEKDGTIDIEKGSVHLSIASSKRLYVISIDCEAYEEAVSQAIDILEEAKEKRM